MRMLSMRKGLALTMAATVAVLAGCSSSKPQATTNPGSNTSAPVSTTKIRFYHAMDPKTAQGKTLQTLIKEFNDSQKEVSVEEVYQQGSYPGVDKAVSNDIQSGGAVPAVIQTSDSGLSNYFDQGALVDVDQYIASDKADLVQSVLPPLTFNGKLYAAPFNKSMIALIYDKTVVKNAPKTWEEFKTAAKDATVKDKKFGTAIEPTSYFFGQFMVQAGGDWLSKDGKTVTFNSDAGAQSMQYLAGLVKDGSATILKQNEFSSNLFNEGRIAMALTTTASFAYITKPADQWAAAPLIAGPKNDLVPFSGANLAILKLAKPEEQKAAGKFIKFMISRDAQVKWAVGETGYMPVRKSSLDTKEWKDFVAAKPNYKVFETSFDKGTIQPNVKNWSSIQKEINAQMDKILLGQVDPKAGLDAAATKSNDLLSKK
jgi:ABC-type glycerol-3-phosphate transport system substrate-binding protein